MATISLCMIVKNEERVLERCLECLKDIVDEMIIVDTGSTDSTKEIAKKYTDKIYDFEWIKDFSAARNYSLSFATKDYIYCADADEVIEPEDGICAIGSGGNYALSAAKALIKNTDLDAKEIAIKAMEIASDICVFTNSNYVVEEV